MSPGLRMRVLEANQLAAEFFAKQLSSPEAVEGRVFLDDRGFTREHAEHFGIGFAPRGGRDLLNHLLAKKFSKDDLVKAGPGARAGWDFFQGRWCGRSGTPAARRSASARAGSSTTTACRPSTSTPPRRWSTRSRTCSTGSTWPGRTSARRTRPSSSRATPT
jgi:hypothetical protein